MAIEMPRVVAATRTVDGEYSTILRDGNILETCFFGNDGSSEVIGVTALTVQEVHRSHIRRHKNSKEL